MEILKWLENKGFVNDRGWKQKDKDGLMVYSLGKGDYRFEICENWDLKFSHYINFYLSIKYCKGEVYCDNGYIGWMGQKPLLRFDKEISKELFEEILKHYNIN